MADLAPGAVADMYRAYVDGLLDDGIDLGDRGRFRPVLTKAPGFPGAFSAKW
ncbi:hypothetical protein [Saccharopolyspora pogona]|uniref:hypothetical protein n=1 Tax=Saccharopolyspora pogona TaxID=333966 RepID=UPI0016831937|nr:hypothetical protein [Saccharopolyspora pogona]